MSEAFYNENDPKAAAWLRELIAAGLIAPGVVDERSITEIKPDDLEGFCQCHFFAGIGGWSYALRLAGWPDDRPVWTGSCPCQPFSSAGKQGGTKDARHLWPWMRHLLFRWRPPIAFGEQVASGLGREWLCGVRANLETLGYVVGAADLCAAGVAAPHIRQRLFWVADAGYHVQPRTRQGRGLEAPERGESCIDAQPDSVDGGLAVSDRAGPFSRKPAAASARYGRPLISDGGFGRMGRIKPGCAGAASVWSTFDLIFCRDGKTRRVESGTFPLAHGVSGRVGLLRGYGNAIVPAIAAQFILAAVESEVAA